MAIAIIDGTNFYYPSPATERVYRNRAKQHLLSSHAVGVHTSAKQITTILRDLLSFYEGELDKLLKPLLSRALLEMVLYQYDQYTSIYQKFVAGKLTTDHEQLWKELLAPNYGRAIKFLAERIVLLERLDAKNYSEALFDKNCESIFACTFAVIDISSQSDQTYYVVPGASELELFPQHHDAVYRLTITDENKKTCLTANFPSRWRWEIREGKNFVSSYGTHLSPELYPDEHGKILDAPFKKELGFTYQEAIATLGGIFDACKPAPNWFPTFFVEKDAFLNNYAWPRTTMDRMFEGFTISAQNIAGEGRSYWNPKFEHRLFRRGILQVKHDGKDFLCWGKSLYQEALMALVNGITFQYMPIEWQHAEIQKSVSELSNGIGKWFEERVEEELRKLQIAAVRSRKGVGQGPSRVVFTPGEIDLLGYIPNERILLVGECKRVQAGTDSKMYRDEITSFVTGKDAYAKKLLSKVEFVSQNLKAVCSALSSNQELGITVSPKWIAPILITRKPTVASCFIPDIPCVSLAELVRDYSQHFAWPYSKSYLLSFEKVQKRAFQIWQESGCMHGHDLSDWLQAEDDLAAQS